MQPDQAPAVLQFLLTELENEVSITRKVIAAVPVSEGSYKPDSRSMSALELAWHIAAAETFFSTAVTTGAFPAYGGGMPETIKTSKDVLQWYDAQTDAHLPKLKSLTPDQCLKVLESPIGSKSGIDVTL